MRKLIPMVDFIIERDKRPFAYRDFCNEILSYANFLNTDLSESMFIGVNAIFPGFIKCTSKQAWASKIDFSFDNCGESEFSIRLFQNGYKAGGKTYDTWVTHFHLKKVEHLTSFGIFYNEYCNL